MMRKNAFTLSEVLVTLGIIGVISAMTVPALVKNYQRQVYVTQLHKVYAEVAQATEQILFDSKATLLSESILRRNGTGALFSYFKTTKTCTNTDLTGCFASTYLNINGTNIAIGNLVPANSTCRILASGASICASGIPTTTNPIRIVADVNGKEGPNVIGRDLFTLRILNNGTVTSSISAASATTGRCTAANTEYGIGNCLGKIIDDGWKMDY